MKRYTHKIVFCVIKGYAIKKFILFDLVTGTGMYYLLKAAFSSVIVGAIGSFIIPEGIKKHIKNKNIIAIKPIKQDQD